MNGISYNNAESERIADLFNQVRTQYGIAIGFDKVDQIFNSDEHSYWDRGQTAVSSGGGWLYYRPNYHGCGDTVANISFTNVLRTTQQNLAVGLKLDQEIFGSSGTPTNTPVPPTPTNTPGPSTPTNTPMPPTPTNTPDPGASFPSTGVLDNFDRANGAIGTNWGGATTGYSIATNRLDVGTGDAILWQTTQFGAEQEVFVTYNTIDGSGVEHDLLLKSQSNTNPLSGVLEVWYDPVNQWVQVWTYSSAQSWVQRGTNLPVTLVNGDRFGARAKANGMVEIYRNGVLLGSRDASGWTYTANGGYIGLWHINSSNAFLDDFGGGTVTSVLAASADAALIENSPNPNGELTTNVTEDSSDTVSSTFFLPIIRR